MKRLLGLLLVMGMVGCGGNALPAGEAALQATPNKPQAKVDEPPVRAVDVSKLVERDGLIHERKSETPFTGVAVRKHENGQKRSESTFKDGKLEEPSTLWHANGQKELEETYKDGKLEGLSTAWHENGQKWSEVTYKDGKREGLATWWHGNGQKQAERTFKDGKKVSEKKWDPAGNEIKE